MLQEDLVIKDKIMLSPGYGLFVLESKNPLPEIKPGQFVQVKIPDSVVYLRRPISICNVDSNNLWLLVRNAGEGTKHLLDTKPGTSINLMLPLGKGFDYKKSNSPLLVGGGVGVAPLLYLAKQINSIGIRPSILLAAKTASQILLIDEFKKYGNVFISTDDGSMGEPGLVTKNSILSSGSFDHIYCCGPMPMMKALAFVSRNLGVSCDVSLENTMGCGIGACLCCVEETKDKGNVCVCKEGPVFNIDRLKW